MVTGFTGSIEPAIWVRSILIRSRCARNGTEEALFMVTEIMFHTETERSAIPGSFTTYAGG